MIHSLGWQMNNQLASRPTLSRDDTLYPVLPTALVIVDSVSYDYEKIRKREHNSDSFASQIPYHFLHLLPLQHEIS
jgi:hypothetical protein